MLKAKSMGFKPKVKPRSNALPSTAASSSSAQPSVERQTTTPATLQQPAALPATSIESSRGQQPGDRNDATRAPAPEGPVISTREERQPVVQQIPATSATRQNVSKPVSASIAPANPPIPATKAVQSNISNSASASTGPNNPLKSASIAKHATTAATSIEPPISHRTASSSQAISTAQPTHHAHPSTTITAPSPTSHAHPTTSTIAPLPTPPASAPSISPPAESASHPSASQENGNVQSRKRSVASSSTAKKVSRPGASGETEAGPSRPAKRRKVAAATNQEDVRPSIEDQDSQSENPAPKRVRKPRDPNAPKRKKKASTPEDAESEVIDIATTTMSDLTKDLHIGRNFSMREKIMEREAERKEKARIAKEKEMLEDSDMSGNEGEEGEEGQNQGDAENADNGTPAGTEANASAKTKAPVVAAAGPRIRVVNGNIIIDESSLQVDRHQLAADAEEEMAIVEEDDFTRKVNSGTNQKREKNTRWDDDDTEKFYQCLRMFGTDFEMISKTFGKKRTRRQIKLKFNKEEKQNADRVTRCLTGVKDEAMDLSKFKNASKMEDGAAVTAELEALEEGYKAEKKRKKDEQDEADREKRAMINAGRAATRGESLRDNEASTGTAQKGSSAAASKAKKKAPAKKNKRQKIQHHGGEEFEVLGTIDD